MDGRQGGARRGIAAALYVLAGLGVLLGVVTVLAIQDSHRRNAATGDFAGASLATAFLLIGVLPSTSAALVLALWLAPPGGRRGREPGRRPDTAPPPRAGGVRAVLIPGLVVAGVVLVGVVGVMLAHALEGARQNYGLRGSALVLLAIQDLILFAPVLLLAGALFWIAAAMTRRGRRSD